MSSKRCRRRVVVPMPPRGLRPKLEQYQVRDLALAHSVNLDAIAKGEAGTDIMWQMIGGVLTWSRVAEMMQVGEPEMIEQMDMARSVIERYRRTGRVGFSGPDYLRARYGVQVMDSLAEIVDRHTALISAEWAERTVNEMELAYKQDRS